MYLTFCLRALGYEDRGGKDFNWERPEHLAQGIGILPREVDNEDFKRKDVAIISLAALSASLKGTADTLLERLVKDGSVMVFDNH